MFPLNLGYNFTHQLKLIWAGAHKIILELIIFRNNSENLRNNDFDF